MTMPGTRVVFNDKEVIATEQIGCNGCEFDKVDCTNFALSTKCTSTGEDPSIIWLTPLNYIAHRLAGETS